MEDFQENPSNLSKFLRQDFEAMLSNESVKDLSILEKKNHIAEGFRKERNTPHFKDVSDEDFEDFIAKINALEPKDDGELIDRSLNIIILLLKQIFPDTTLLEENLRNTLNESHGRKEINKVLAYQVEGNQIEIHIPPVITETPTQLKALFLDGLRKLAHEIKTDSSLENINTIVGRSWIIFEHPKLAEALGFTVENRDDIEGLAVATISKNKLLELYN